MSSPKAQNAIGARCQRCKDQRKRCSRTRPCERCAALGIDHDGCVPSTNLQGQASDGASSSPILQTPPQSSPESTHNNQDFQTVQSASLPANEPRSENTRPTRKALQGVPTLVTDENGTARIQMSSSSPIVTKKKIEDKIQAAENTEKTNAPQPPQSEANKALQPPAWTPSGPQTTFTLRQALALGLEQGFSVEDLRQNRSHEQQDEEEEEEEEEEESQCIDPAKLTRHHLHEGRYFIHDAGWFEKFDVCKDCEGEFGQHQWWCSHFEL